MANVNMDGDQSFLLNTIKQVIADGGRVSHILNAKISNQGDYGTRIRKALFRELKDRPITHDINGVNVTITWKTSAQESSAYYYTDVTMFTDPVVQRHTELTLVQILNAITPRFPNLQDGSAGLAFLVTRPLMKDVNVLGAGEDVL